MVALFAALTVTCSLTIIALWMVLRRKPSVNVWLAAAPVAACTLWITLMALGIGSQSLSNIVEVLGLSALTVIASLIKMVVYDRLNPHARRGVAWVFALVISLTIFVRLLTPELPE